MTDDALEALDRMIDEDSRRRQEEMAAKDEEIARLRARIADLGRLARLYADGNQHEALLLSRKLGLEADDE